MSWTTEGKGEKEPNCLNAGKHTFTWGGQVHFISVKRRNTLRVHRMPSIWLFHQLSRVDSPARTVPLSHLSTGYCSRSGQVWFHYNQCPVPSAWDQVPGRTVRYLRRADTPVTPREAVCETSSSQADLLGPAGGRARGVAYMPSGPQGLRPQKPCSSSPASHSPAQSLLGAQESSANKLFFF